MFYKGTMRTNNINNIYNLHAIKQKERLNIESKQGIMRTGALSEQKYDLNRPAQAISFGGSKNLVEKFVTSKAINKTIEVVADNEALYSAILSLLVAGVIKPRLVLAMPGSEDKDKQIVATKNFLQAFIGSFLNITVGANLVKKSIDVVKNDLKLVEIDKKTKKLKPVAVDSENAIEIARESLKKQQASNFIRLKKAFLRAQSSEGNKIKAFLTSMGDKGRVIPSQAEVKRYAKVLVEDFANNRFKIFQKNEDYIKSLLSKEALNCGTLKDAFESFWKNSTGAMTAIGKAKISSLLLPGVMAFLFAKKNLEAEKEKHKNDKVYSTLVNTSAFKKDQQNYQAFLNTPKVRQPAFTGNAISAFAKGIETIAVTKPAQKAVELLSHSKKPSARMADLESALITAYWINNTTHSKKIEPDQKLGLNIHTGLVTVVSSACAFAIDWLFDGIIKKCTDTYKELAIKTVGDIVSGKPTEGIYSNKKLAEALSKQGKESLGKFLDIKSTISSKELQKKYLISQSAKVQLGKQIEELQENLDYKNCMKVIDSFAGKYSKYLSKLKSLTIFTIVVRLAVPVLMVPFSGRLKKFVKEAQANFSKKKVAVEKKN